MLKRALVITAVVLGAQSGVALADNDYVYDAPFWQQTFAGKGAERTSFQSTQLDSFASYELVDGYAN